MNLGRIRKLSDVRQFKRALSQVDKLLAQQPDCPYLWNYRGNLIQLLDEGDVPAVDEAKTSYLKALEVNPDDLEALENLAHFYDTVGHSPIEAKKYATAYVEKARKSLVAMERILSEE